MIRKWLELNFSVSRREYNGLVALAVLILLIRVVSTAISWWQHEQTTPVSAAELVMIRELESLPEPQSRFSPSKKNRQQHMASSQLFRFDPNTASVQDWQRLGLSAKQAAAIIRYREKGGVFRKKSDVARMYTIRPDLYTRLEPYIDIEEIEVKSGINQPVAKPVAPIIALHDADSAMLTTVRGLGPAFASRIIRYRDRLGGFYTLLQLKEVYGMDSMRLAQILPQLSLDAGRIKRIFINKINFDELKGHPYLRYKQISALIAYRNQHGPFKSGEDLKKVVILPPETIQKLEPYLNFND
ncbi:ComEA family DNA-binding protein [Pedobacter sp. SYP-B3415]|uniref:ComEA family DNA-binding protein n=1 Tax=Pedobacter sp. SYP-B3415 TaxID=2496641 RepID=UPI00101CAC23|nr:helix-hairpin-helix domain-containing protein [Pedobacter sp. SYP-B3415]